MRKKCLAKWTSWKIHSYQKKWVYRYMCVSSENLATCYFWVLKLHRALIYLNRISFQMDWWFENRPYDLILPGLCMPDFESSHIGLIISWADNCIAIEVANQKLGPSPACKPKLQQAGIYYLVITFNYCTSTYEKALEHSFPDKFVVSQNTSIGK